MTNFIFCLIFIQVSVFLITGVLLLTSLYIGFRENRRAQEASRTHSSGYSREIALTRTEIEYFMADEAA